MGGLHCQHSLVCQLGVVVVRVVDAGGGRRWSFRGVVVAVSLTCVVVEVVAGGDDIVAMVVEHAGRRRRCRRWWRWQLSRSGVVVVGSRWWSLVAVVWEMVGVVVVAIECGGWRGWWGRWLSLLGVVVVVSLKWMH